MAERAEPRFPMRIVMSRSGLSADLLRAWERRYGAVRPQRSAGGQRLYSEDDVARLTLLRRATLAGHSIAEIARLDMSALEALVEGPKPRHAEPAAELVAAITKAALQATERLDGPGVEAALKRGALTAGTASLVERIVPDFLWRVGDLWHAGTISPAHEHVASTAVRHVLGWAIEAYAPGARAPRIVVATPSGEMHEFGAMLAAAVAAEEGWRVVYLGASLPANAIVDAARQVGARAVALSVVYEERAVAEEVPAIARDLPRGTMLLLGGAPSQRPADALAESGVRMLTDMPALRRALWSLRAASVVDERRTRE